MKAQTAALHGLAACHCCGLLSHVGSRHGGLCPRCGSAVHLRKPDSIARTWAFILAAAIMYIPANLLPIMVTETLFGKQADTIMSGVAYLWHSGSWPLAVIVFVASVAVPLLKLAILTMLVLSIQLDFWKESLPRTRLYRLVEFVGKWSMLDIFVVAVMVALVQLKVLATITVGPATLPFAAVVVLTMIASDSFDPRLIWDTQEKHHA